MPLRLLREARRLCGRFETLRSSSYGQFQNSPTGATPVTHIYYGYPSYVKGLSVFSGAPQNETTALFTFFADAATLRVISNGPSASSRASES